VEERLADIFGVGRGRILADGEVSLLSDFVVPGSRQTRRTPSRWKHSRPSHSHRYGCSCSSIPNHSRDRVRRTETAGKRSPGRPHHKELLLLAQSRRPRSNLPRRDGSG